MEYQFLVTIRYEDGRLGYVPATMLSITSKGISYIDALTREAEFIPTDEFDSLTIAPIMLVEGD